MDNLPLPEADKARYKQGLRHLWHALQSSPKGSPQAQEAQKKISDFSGQLMAKLRTSRPASQAGSQDQSLAAASAGSPVASGAGQQAPTPAPAGAANPPGQPPQQGAAHPMMKITPQIRSHLEAMVYVPPQDVVDQGQEAAAQWTKLNKDKYSKAVIQMATFGDKIKECDAAIGPLRQKGAALTPEETKKLQEIIQTKTKYVAVHGNCKNWAETFRKEQVQIKEARGLSAGGAQDGAANQNQNQNQNQQQANGPSPPQPGNNNANIQQPGGGVKAEGQQPGGAGRLPGANGQPGQQQPATQATSSAPPQASPITTAQPALGASSQQQIKIEPGTQQHQQQQQPQQTHPVPPPVNTNIANVSGASGVPSAGTPTHTQHNVARMPATPQNATPTTANAPRPLSHQAALHIANQNRNSQTGLQGTPLGQGATPSSATVMGSTSQQLPQGHPHAHPGNNANNTQQQQQPQTALQQKLPIPHTLSEKAAAPPQPVPTNLGGVTPGRPTYTQGGGTPGGVMGQPVLPKIPVVQMEGEGERVMNRKKLDDLVRQVCGGQAEGQEGSNALSPDVEEVRCPYQRKLRFALIVLPLAFHSINDSNVHPANNNTPI